MLDFSMDPNSSPVPPSNSLDSRVETWAPPPSGVLKVNVDVALSKGKAALAYIARDDSSLLVSEESSLTTAPSAFITELMAVN